MLCSPLALPACLFCQMCAMPDRQTFSCGFWNPITDTAVSVFSNLKLLWDGDVVVPSDLFPECLLINVSDWQPRETFISFCHDEALIEICCLHWVDFVASGVWLSLCMCSLCKFGSLDCVQFTVEGSQRDENVLFLINVNVGRSALDKEPL